MKTIFDLKVFNNIHLFTGAYFIFFLNILYPPFAHAENIQNLQHNASTAYEHMMRVKQSAETLAKDAAFAERKLASIKQKLSAAEQEAEAARRKSEQARISLEQAISRWKQATDILADEWRKTDRK